MCRACVLIFLNFDLYPPQTHKVYATKDKPVSSEMFVALVTERLLAVEKDRLAMEKRVRDDARQMGKSYIEIMVSECVCVCV